MEDQRWRLGGVVVTEREVLARRGYALGNGRLGEGRYSKVKEATKGGRGFAVKIMDLSKLSGNFWERWGRRELELMAGLRHVGVVGLEEWWQTGSKVFAVLELGRGGDLLRLVQRTGAFPETAAQDSTVQLTRAIHYLHSHRIAHRDLKLENVMVGEPVSTHPPRPLLKIGDFTFARTVLTEGSLCSTYCGSKAYSCPEILSSTPYCAYRADVWALGVLVYILLVGRMPFNERVPSRADIVAQQRGSSYIHRLQRQPLSEAARSFVLFALSFHQTERPKAHALLGHPFLAAAPAPPHSAAAAALVARAEAGEPGGTLPPPVPSETNTYQ